ncbi:hypothetical protein PQX77_020386 [Marasmius sp. AFHP31]|nr:hypothetical protein PQX77_020386 [Marasmius sp. AFHP31]
MPFGKIQHVVQFLTLLVPIAIAWPLPEFEQITTLSNDQIKFYRPYTHYASAAYCSPSKISNWSCGQDCLANPTFTPIKTGGNGAAVQFWYVGYDASLKTVVVGHQGTDTSKIQAVITDLKLVPMSLNSDLFPNISTSIKVHLGFKREHAKTAKDVLQAVKMTMNKFSATDLAVVGHSLGGALALLDSVYLANNLPLTTKVKMVGYGMPRVGNEAFANYVDKHDMITHSHVTNKKDPIPVVPGRRLGYHHCHGEIHIKKDDKWVSCPGHDNPSSQCSTGDVNILDARVNDHSGPYDGILMGSDC